MAFTKGFLPESEKLRLTVSDPAGSAVSGETWRKNVSARIILGLPNNPHVADDLTHKPVPGSDAANREAIHVTKKIILPTLPVFPIAKAKSRGKVTLKPSNTYADAAAKAQSDATAKTDATVKTDGSDTDEDIAAYLEAELKKLKLQAEVARLELENKKLESADYQVCIALKDSVESNTWTTFKTAYPEAETAVLASNPRKLFDLLWEFSNKSIVTSSLKTGVTAIDELIYLEHEVGTPVLKFFENIKVKYDNCLRIVLDLVPELKGISLEALEPLIAYYVMTKLNSTEHGDFKERMFLRADDKSAAASIPTTVLEMLKLAQQQSMTSSGDVNYGLRGKAPTGPIPPSNPKPTRQVLPKNQQCTTPKCQLGSGNGACQFHTTKDCKQKQDQPKQDQAKQGDKKAENAWTQQKNKKKNKKKGQHAVNQVDDAVLDTEMSLLEKTGFTAALDAANSVEKK